MGLCQRGRTRGLTLTKMIHLKMAHGLGLRVPDKMLAGADEATQ
jgi:hypothetical protein